MNKLSRECWPMINLKLTANIAWVNFMIRTSLLKLEENIVRYISLYKYKYLICSILTRQFSGYVLRLFKQYLITLPQKWKLGIEPISGLLKAVLPLH